MGEASRRKALGLHPKGKPEHFSIKPQAFFSSNPKEGQCTSIEGQVYEMYRGSLHKVSPAFIKKKNLFRKRQEIENLHLEALAEDSLRSEFLARRHPISTIEGDPHVEDDSGDGADRS